MKTLLSKLTLVALLVGAAATRALALDGIVIVNGDTAVTSLDAGALKDVFTGKTTYWTGGQAVVIVTAGDKADAALEQASGMNASAFKTFWQRLAFSGRGQQPKKADDAAAAVALVAATKGAVCVVPAGTELKGVKQVEIK